VENVPLVNLFLDYGSAPSYRPAVRVVLLGKGGSGKSTLGGLLSAELSSRGERVVAMNADSVPGIDQVLGMVPTDDWFLAGMATRDNGGWKLEGTPAEIVDRCAREGPGGVRFLQVGNADATVKDFEFRRESFLDRWSGTVAFSTVSRSYALWTIEGLFRPIFRPSAATGNSTPASVR